MSNGGRRCPASAYTDMSSPGVSCWSRTRSAPVQRSRITATCETVAVEAEVKIAFVPER